MKLIVFVLGILAIVFYPGDAVVRAQRVPTHSATSTYK